MGSTWASSVYSPAIGQISEQFHVRGEVGLLGLSFLLMGFGLGPLLWAPLSEMSVYPSLEDEEYADRIPDTAGGPQF